MMFLYLQFFIYYAQHLFLRFRTFFNLSILFAAMEKPIEVMLSPSSVLNTKNFLALYGVALAQYPNPTIALRRYNVSKVRSRKSRNSSEHKFLVIDVTDAEGSLTTQLLLERTVNDDRALQFNIDEDSLMRLFLHQDRKSVV